MGRKVSVVFASRLVRRRSPRVCGSGTPTGFRSIAIGGMWGERRVVSVIAGRHVPKS